MRTAKKILAALLGIAMIVSLTPTAGVSAYEQPSATALAAEPPPATVGGVYSAGMNPYVPLWDYNPDTDPHVFHDPDNPGKFRLYLFNSHDTQTTAYCGPDQVLWSAPVEDLTQWTYHGVIVNQAITGGANNDVFYAPTVCEVDNHDGTYTYYYIPFSQGGGRASMMLKASRPEGPYTVINWNGSSRTQTTGAPWNFDPAIFVDDDGRIYGYWGGYNSPINGAEMDPTAPYNVKPGSSIVQVAPLYNGTNGSALSVFEAVAMSKMTFGGHTKYVMTYARRGLSGEPWGTTSAMKAYATSDSPLGPFEYGGPLVFAGGEIVNGSATFTQHNTHGNLFEVNGQWYISYHRATNNNGYSRQAMVEAVYPYWDDAAGKLVIPMAEVTSQGFYTNGLDPYKTYSAGYACYTSGGPYVAPVPASRRGVTVTNNNVVTLNNNSLVGYKYFNFKPAPAGKHTRLSVDFTPRGVNGTINVFIGNPNKAADNAKQIGSIAISSTMPQTSTTFKINTPLLDLAENTGKYPLFFRFTSSSGSLGSLDYFGFSQEAMTEDIFVAGAKDSSWVIAKPNDAAWALAKGSGLVLPTQAGDMAGPAASFENLFLQPMDGDWDAVTKVHFPVAPSADYQQAALLAWQDEDNYIKINVGKSVNGVGARLVAEQGGSYSDSTDPLAPGIAAGDDGSLTAYLRITKTGAQYKGYFSTDGINYSLIGEVSPSIAFTKPNIGLFATKAGGDAPAIDANFEFVSLLSLNGETVSTLEQMLQKEVDAVLGYVSQDVPMTASEDIVFSKIPHGFTLTVASDKPDVISTSGKVTPLEKVTSDVKLDITVSDGARTASRPMTVRVPKYGVAYPESDSFILGAKSPSWTIVRQDDAEWSIDKGFGLRLPTQQGDIHANTDYKNLFLQPADGDWEVVSKMYYPVAQNASYQQNALVVWQDALNFVKLDCEATSATARRIQFGTMTNGSFASTQTPNSGTVAADADGSLTLYFKIKKTGDSYAGSYSRDGVTFTNVGNARTLALTDAQIGLFATKNQAAAPVIQTYVEYLSVLSIGDRQLLTTDDMLRNAVEKAAMAAADLIPKNVSGDINLKLLPFSYTVSIASGNQAYISDTGAVTQPNGDDVDVPVTVTVSNGTKSASRDATIKVVGKRQLDAKAVMGASNGTASVVVDVYSGPDDISASVIAAAYNKKGQMAAYSVKEADVLKGKHEIAVFGLDLSKAGDDYTVKVFVWDKQTMAPLLDVVTPAVVADPLVSKTPETYCNPINISYRYQVDEATGWYRAVADTQPVYYRGEYWLFPTCASGYFHSSDLINWKFVYSAAPQIDTYAPGAFVLGDYLYVGRFNGNIYKSNNPMDGNSWQAVRTGNTNYADPYFFMDDETGRLFVLQGCSGLRDTNIGVTPAIRILELDTSSPTLAPKAGQPTNGTTVLFMNRNIHGYEVPGQLNDNYAATAQSWLEGAGMIKHDGKYYAYYCGPGTEYAGYSDGLYVADDPLGPYTWCENSPFVYKSTGFTMGAAHGHHVVEQTSGRIWKFGTIAISNRNIFERRASLYPVGFNSLGQPTTDLTLADYPMWLPTNPKGTFENQGPDWNLVSYGLKATASSTYDVDVVPVGATKMAPFHIGTDKAFDESIRTWWSAETGDAGEWLMGDMGKARAVSAVQLNFADQDAKRLSTSQPAAREYDGCYRYLLEYSLDGETWFAIADKSDYTAEPFKAQDYSHDYYELAKAIPMRYIRVTNKGPVPAEGKFAISDLRLFGEAESDGALPGKVDDFQLSRVEGRDGRTVQVSWNAAEGAEGYLIRFGTRPDEVNLHHQVIGKTSEIINVLSTHTDATKAMPVEYYFRIDTYNSNGRTVGTKLIKLVN